MKSIFNIDCIDVKTYGWDNGFDIEIDDGRSSIIISTPLSFYKIIRSIYEKKKPRKNMGKYSYEKVRHVPKT